jgi:hypothetical protein
MKGDRKMKYKTSEAIAMLEKNPRAKLTTTLGGNKYELLVDGKSNNYFVFNVYTENGEKISSSTGDGGFNYNIPTDLKWELIQQPVDFITAVNSKNRIKVVYQPQYVDTRYLYFNDLIKALSCLNLQEIITKGTWYVEDSNE